MGASRPAPGRFATLRTPWTRALRVAVTTGLGAATINAAVACNPEDSLNTLSDLYTVPFQLGEPRKLADGEFSELRTTYFERNALVFALDEAGERYVFTPSTEEELVHVPETGDVPHCSFGKLEGLPFDPLGISFTLFLVEWARGPNRDGDTLTGIRTFVFRSHDEATGRGTLDLVDMRCNSLIEPIEGAYWPSSLGPWFLTDTSGGDVLAIHGVTGEVRTLATEGRLVHVSDPKSLTAIDNQIEWASDILIQEGDYARMLHVSSANPDEFEVGAELGPGLGKIEVGEQLAGLGVSPTGATENSITLELDSSVRFLSRWPRLGETLEDVHLLELAGSCLLPSADTPFVDYAIEAPCGSGRGFASWLLHPAVPLPKDAQFVTFGQSFALASAAPPGTPTHWWYVDENASMLVADDIIEVLDAEPPNFAFRVAGSEPGRTDLLEWSLEHGGELVLHDITAGWGAYTFAARSQKDDPKPTNDAGAPLLGVGDAYRRVEPLPDDPTAPVEYEHLAEKVPRSEIERGGRWLSATAWFEHSDDGVTGDLRFAYLSEDVTTYDEIDWFPVFARKVLPEGVAFFHQRTDEFDADARLPRGALLIHDYDATRRAGTLSVLDADNERYESPSIDDVRDLERLEDDVFFSRVGDDAGLYFISLSYVPHHVWAD